MISRTVLGARRFQTRLKPVSGWPPLVALIDLMFLLLLFTRVPHVRVIFNYILTHFIHSVHQQLECLPQVIAEI